jgi:uroporphyrin-III C-methyltransferase/precorrin-2 dehydrogenase/sirohydrochlorin ferrochelatase
MPAALVEQGTTPSQRVFIGSLATLPDIVRPAGVKSPSLVIVGEVVPLHDKLAWFEPVAAEYSTSNDPVIKD